MDIKTVLVHADPGPGSNRRVRLAVDIADRFGATVTGLGAEACDLEISSGDANVDGAVMVALQEKVAVDLPAAEAHFRQLTAGHPGFTWIANENYPDKALALHARAADLIVASRPARGESATRAARISDLVMEAGVPVLVAADGEAPFRGRNVVVAWKDTRESRRALTDAIPFLVRAQNVVVVAICGKADTHGDHSIGLAEVSRRLAQHGVQSTVEVVPKGRGAVTECLEDVANRHSADLIVAGAYGHSRLQEWWLGGVTEDLAAACPKFVLLSH